MTRTEFLNETHLIRGDIKKLDEKLGTGINSLEQRVGSLDRRVGSLEVAVGSLGKTVGSLGQTVGSLDGNYKGLTKEFIDFKVRLQYVEENMMHKDAEKRILDRIDAFAHRVETYDRKAWVHDERFKQIETRLTRLESK